MRIAANTLTPLEILNAIECLSITEQETLAILVDEKLSRELMKRRLNAFIEMKNNKLLSEAELFSEN